MNEAAATFQFRTKAQNLLQLNHHVRRSRVCAIEVVEVGEWESDPTAVLTRIVDRFAPQPIIVRSSATGEDTALSSMAGAFDSVANVNSTDGNAIGAAIDGVVDSYRHRDIEPLAHQEVLVQPMVADVVLSGVVFSRDLERNLPYYLINYEESDRTDGITAGTTGAPQRVVRVFRGAQSDGLDAPLDTIVEAVREIEELTSCSAIDIEFALDAAGTFYLLQARPLVRTHVVSHDLLDRRLAGHIEAMKELVTTRFTVRPGLCGPTTALGEMPDWNPAEIIGTHPTPLAMSLYRNIIMKSVWRDARGELGYRNPFPHQLLVSVANRPYVDVRNSFNSFVPASIPDGLADKLVTHYVDRLHRHPEFHDKVEFEIVLSSVTFDVERDENRLRSDGFSEAEIAMLRAGLLEITNRAVHATQTRTERFESDVAQLDARRRRVLDSSVGVEASPFIVAQLLEDCQRYGTLPFSIAARCAFIAMASLRSLVDRDLLTVDGLQSYTNSIDTVASALVRELDLLRAGTLPLDDFLTRYGHLRPGTYDVRAHTYADRPDEYLTLSCAPTGAVHDAPPPEAVHLTDVVDAEPLGKLLGALGFEFGIDALDAFIKASVRQREWLKLEFTKNLSCALDELSVFGRHHGLDRDDIAFLDIESVLRYANASMSADDIVRLRSEIEHARNDHELTSSIPLPDLIFSPRDIEVVSDQRRKPNFVTLRTVTAPSITLRDASEIPADTELAGHIVLIENADPGYDWLFSKSIAGLCTKYGGAASHMTIRCAEFGTPAAIGCGEQIFSELRKAEAIRLNCRQKTVELYGT